MINKILTISFFCISLFSCKRDGKPTIEFDQKIQYVNDTVFYTLAIKNISNKNLMILVPNNYYQAKNCPEKHFIFDAVPGKLEPEFFCTDSVINNLNTIEYFFVSYNEMNLNDSLLVQKLLKNIKVDLKEDMISFLNPTQWSYPVFLFIEANSEIEYKYYTTGLFPPGQYFFTYDFPSNLYQSKKYKEWVTELNKLSSVNNYFFYEVKLKGNGGVQFEIK